MVWRRESELMPEVMKRRRGPVNAAA